MEAGHPATARYPGNGPHQTATFFSGHRSDKDKGTPGEEQQRHTCEYAFSELGQREKGAPQSYPLYSYTVYGLRTGRVVKTTTRTSQKGCPTGVVVSAGRSESLSKMYAQLSRWDTASALKSVVEGPAR